MACKHNATESSVARQMCLLQMCQSITLEERKQPMLGEFPTPWTFTVENTLDPSSSCNKDGCPCTYSHASGNWVLRAFCGTISHDCIHAALVGSGYTASKASEMIVDFFSAKLGMEMRTAINHELVGRGYYRRWVGASGDLQDISGVITSCCKRRIDNEILFRVDYEKKTLPITVVGSTFSSFEEISEHNARGGAICFDERRSPRLHSVNAPRFHWRWVTPDKRSVLAGDDEATTPKLEMIVCEFRLLFEARESTIPGAGLGLFVQCFSESAKQFVLAPGCLLDLGRYSPLCCTDRKQMSVAHVKNYVLDRKSEEWEFDASPSERENVIFDVSWKIQSQAAR